MLGYGTAPLGKEKITREHAMKCLNHAIDRGITYLDTSPGYGSEPHIGEVMKDRRKEVFLATKVDRRSKEGVLKEIQESLRKLQTDHVDLIQVHSVAAWADLEQALAPDGACAALEQAKKDGLVRFIGITGHARPAILGKALEEYPFDTVLCALGMADRLITSPETFLLPRARERNVGVIAMKTLGHGHFPDASLALRYALGLPGVSLAIVGMDRIEHIDQNVEIAANFKPLSEDEMTELITQVRPLVQEDAQKNQEGGGKSDLFWLHDTAVTGWKEEDEPVLVSY
ncbi:MAG TPA: aldo/keto reductase [Chloroflexota bacterium]|nr:aldo/keto reductase [Chloroflexota bacterium]